MMFRRRTYKMPFDLLRGFVVSKSKSKNAWLLAQMKALTDRYSRRDDEKTRRSSVRSHFATYSKRLGLYLCRRRPSVALVPFYLH